MLITRRIEFCAAHRLYRPDWTQTQNSEIFGECANPYGHGHNYLLDVTFKGTPDPETGLIIHFRRLKELLHELVHAPLDHRNMNHDVAFLEGILPTSENVVRELWKRISGQLPKGINLYSLKLQASPRNWVEYFGSEIGC